MGFLQSILSSYPAGSSAPPAPPFTNALSAWGTILSNNAGNPQGQAVYCTDDDGGGSDIFSVYALGSPYPVEWTDFDGTVPPLRVNTLSDQNISTANNFTAAGAQSPTLVVPSGGNPGYIAFDRTAPNGMGSSNSLLNGGSLTVSIWLDYQPTDLTNTGVVLETGSGIAVDSGQQISIRQVANVLTCSVYDDSLIPLANTKIATLTGSRVLVNFQIDTTQGTVANQTYLAINNSTTGVTSPTSTNLNSLLIGVGNGSLGCRDAGGTPSNGWTGKLFTMTPYVEAIYADAAFQLQVYNYWVYLRAQGF